MSEPHIQLPAVQTHATAWYGPAMMAQPDRWVFHLDSQDVGELKAALNSAEKQRLDITELNQDTFVLPSLGPKLRHLQRDLVEGIGFALIKGLPIEEFSTWQAAALFYGLGRYIGHPRSQNAKGHILGHVRDLGLQSSDPNVRIYQTKERQSFHTDSADVVGLLCLKQAQEGGDSLLVSALTIYNEFLKRRPDLLPRLFDPIATDRRGEIPEGMKPYFQIPVFSWFQEHLTVLYQRQYIDAAQRFADAPRLTADHVAALDLFDELANSAELNMTMRLAPGDMQFVYNHSLLHDRTGFVDWPEDSQRRHLLRLWLSVPDDRPLPSVFAERFGTTTIGNRGGIVVPGMSFMAPLSP
ncbi:TauD/TfdA family dioxygenase [Rhodovibrionaceae bacterium A322]